MFKTIMRTTWCLALAAALGVSFVGSRVWAEEKPEFKNDMEKASYGIGLTFGNQIKRAGFEVDLDVIVAGMKDVLGGQEPRLNDQQAREAIMAYQADYRKRAAEENKKKGEAFLEANKKKPGVEIHTVKLSDGTTAELQYKIIKEGTGQKPATNDIATVNYRGTLIDGEEFDSSAKRGQPAKFPVTRVVRGWSEALQLMPVGSKWELYIPSSLAYGDMGTGGIPPGSTLVFEVELLGVETPPPPKPPTPAQPLTSDIIRVPSAEEMKKGAKIEVIKQEELEKRIQEEKEKEKK